MRRSNSQPRRWALSIAAVGPWKAFGPVQRSRRLCSRRACGKKGPPLAPIVHIPAAVEQIEARRAGNDVAVTVTVPSKNIDGSVPVDIGRIEVYGYTGTAAPPRGRFLDVATLVGTITITAAEARHADTGCAAAPGEPVPGGP